ncbi:hypothetical protein GF407_01410 [candidate division KSB1 bacterium]|nr:hypothetical protein [candidate division KSB1 bacterium]
MKKYISILLFGPLIVINSSCDIFLKEVSEFTMTIYPDSMQAIAGQKCAFLIQAENRIDGRAMKDAISISANPSTNVTINPGSLKSGEIAEITITPSSADINKTLYYKIRTKREGFEQEETIGVKVVSGTDQFAGTAVQIRDRFVSYLETYQSHLGITGNTEWTGTIVTPNLTVVSNYLFFSDNWEMGVTWHVTVAPNDWAKIYLRRRYSEIRPSHAFRISSLSAAASPVPSSVPYNVIR